MADAILSVRTCDEGDYERIVDYFLRADPNFLLGMGVDISRLPDRAVWLQVLAEDHLRPVEQKNFFYLLWLADGVPVGHSNINKIIFGEEAYMHLHLWHTDKRQKGMGLAWLKMSLPRYFDQFKLKKLYCEPYAHNPAPNKTLERLGFELLGQYETVPGWINFYQPVNRWRMSHERYKELIP
jgi:RimJ/RimL family protein N-acetyltransferase